MTKWADPLFLIQAGSSLTDQQMKDLGPAGPTIRIQEGHILTMRSGVPLSELATLDSLDDIDTTGRAAGDALRYDSGSESFEPASDRAVPYATVADSNVITNTVTETAFDTAVTIPQTALVSGASWRISIGGKIKNTGGHTMVLRVKLATTLIFASETFNPNSGTDIAWRLILDVTVRTPTALMVMQSMGSYDTELLIPPVPGGTVTPPGSMSLNVTGQWSAADVNDAIQMLQLTAEVLQP